MSMVQGYQGQRPWLVGNYPMARLSDYAMNVGVDLPLEDFEWHRPGEKHRRVEVLGRKSVAERGLRLVSQFEDLELADQVCARLAGVDDVAFDLAGFDPVVDGLLTRPVFGVKPGIDHQPSGAEQLRVQLSQPAFQVAFVPS